MLAFQKDSQQGTQPIRLNIVLESIDPLTSAPQGRFSAQLSDGLAWGPNIERLLDGIRRLLSGLSLAGSWIASLVSFQSRAATPGPVIVF